MPLSFKTLFSVATGGRSPYEYQSRLACGERGDKGEEVWLSSGPQCGSQLIDIPTGLGKTAAVVMAWLWNRVILKDPEWPRRLVYCLPMRTLVEQTEEEVKKWITAVLVDEKGELDLDDQTKTTLRWLNENSPVILMGGEDGGEWDIYPEREAILIGTQDMLLSRALNRGYGMSRYRWPMHFGLLNNDALWVMDETQLMGVGVETSAQLDSFRDREEWRTHGGCPTWWMSATLEQGRLATVDHPTPASGWPSVTLSDEERTAGRAHDLIESKKTVSRCPLELNPATKVGYPKDLAAIIKEQHKEGTLTLVVVNRVKRAREIYEALTGGKKPLCELKQVALIHSRFRPQHRKRQTALLLGSGDRIVIATQAVEAGVDVSARLLITELAPWSSIVQRIGRCNRRADIDNAEVLWVDIQPKDENDDLLLPYSKAELDKARAAVSTLTDASPRILSGIAVPDAPVIRPVIRRRDLVDLFDTTPDLCGQDIDVSRYIRDGEDSDVQFFWRNIEGDAPTSDEPPPQRDELCRVSIGEAAKFLGKAEAWTWNPLDKKWEKAGRPRPGAVYLMKVSSGGYHDDLGWTGDPKHKPTLPRRANGVNEGYDDDLLTFTASKEEAKFRDFSGEVHEADNFRAIRNTAVWQSITEHTRYVTEATAALASALALDAGIAATLRTAALWHDVGKAHDVFQTMLCRDDQSRRGTLWAKSDRRGGKFSRPGFRHELASALAWLLTGPLDTPERDLIAYLVAAHHGKVRLSIRSLPNELEPPKKDRPFARGIWDGDELPAVACGDIGTPAVTLDLSFMKMGEGPHGPSWLARAVALRDRFGPFRLAFLEGILRAADARASAGG